MSLGKLPYSEMLEIIGRVRSVYRASTIIGPRIGEDSAVIDLGDCLLVSHVDPITEASAGAGSLAVIVASNDVAVTGARPSWAHLLLLAPQGYSLGKLKALVEEIRITAEKIGIEIIGGHTERAPGIIKPIIALTVMGCACRNCLTLTSSAKPGEYIIQIGSAGREGASILARDFPSLLVKKGVSMDEIEELRRIGEDLSVVEIAVELAESNLVSSMHDATEGGILGALIEMSLASNNVFEVERDRILVHPLLQKISVKLGIDPLKLISSGALIATADEDKLGEILELTRLSNLEASIIGRVREGREPGLRLLAGKETVFYKEPPIDEISRVWRGELE